MAIRLLFLPECLTWLERLPEIRLHGFHFHLISHQLDAATHPALLGRYLRQARQWREQFGLDINHLNLGGGLGINYREPGLSAYPSEIHTTESQAEVYKERA